MPSTKGKESPLLLLSPRLQGCVAQRLSVGFQIQRSQVLVPEVTLLLSLAEVLGEEEMEEEVVDDDDEDDDEETAAPTSPLVDESLGTRQEGTLMLRQPMKGGKR